MEEQCEPAHAVLDVTAITALDSHKVENNGNTGQESNCARLSLLWWNGVLGWGHSISASFACSADFEGVSLFV